MFGRCAIISCPTIWLRVLII